MEMQDPIVSICCITFNQVKYISQCIEGFLMQRTNFKYEIIVNDDCSTDGTTEIVRKYAMEYPEIVKPLFHKENEFTKGKDVLQNCLDVAKGKYIAICEGDDYWIDPLKLQVQVDFLDSHSDYSMCFHNAFLYNPSKGDVRVFNRAYVDEQDMDINDAISKWLVPTASIMYRSQNYRHYPSNLERIYSGDYSLILILISQAKVKYINKVMSVYRRSDGSMTGNTDNTFAYKEQMKLLKSYDLFTDLKFHNIIKKQLKYLSDKIVYIDIRKNHHYYKSFMILPFIFNLIKNRKRF